MAEDILLFSNRLTEDHFSIWIIQLGRCLGQFQDTNSCHQNDPQHLAFCKGKEVSVANPFKSFVLLFKVDGEAVGPWLIQLCPSDRVKDGIVRTWD